MYLDNYIDIYNSYWNNQMLPLALSFHVFVSETYAKVSNINLKSVTNQIVFPKLFRLVYLAVIYFCHFS